MPSRRKFYKSRAVIDVLSDEPLSTGMDLGDLDYAIDVGEVLGDFKLEIANEEIDGLAAVKFMQAHGSNPGYFMLDKNGNDIVAARRVGDGQEGA